MYSVIFFLLSINTFSFAQETAVNTVSTETVLKGMEKRKQKALQSGDEEKAEGIDAMIKDLKAGKITPEEVMKQRESKSGYQPKPEDMIKSLEKEKQNALQSGDKAKAEAIDAMINDFKAGKITTEEVIKKKETASAYQPKHEDILIGLEKEKQNALQSGDKAKAEAIDAMINDFKAGKITTEEVIKKAKTTKDVIASEVIIGYLKRTKEEILISGDIKDADEIDSVIEDFESEKMDFEKLYAIYSILEERHIKNNKKF